MQEGPPPNARRHIPWLVGRYLGLARRSPQVGRKLPCMEGRSLSIGGRYPAHGRKV